MSAAALRGPSVDAAARLEDQLGSAGGSWDGATKARVGSDLFAITAVLRGEPRLRRALTDVSVAAEAKAALVRDVFGGKADSGAVDLVALGAGQRWSSIRDLADTLEHLGVQATVRSAADAGKVSEELFDVERLLTVDPGLRDALADPARSDADKRQLLHGLLAGKVSEATLGLVGQASSGSYRTVALAVAEFQRIAAAVRGESVATVRTARPLTDAEIGRLTAALSTQYSRSIHLNVIIDPSLVGGLRVEIGNDVIDGSVQSRLDDARRRLAG